MKISKLRRFKVLALLGLPLIALAVVVVMLSSSLGSGGTPQASAANPGTDFSMNVRGVAGCDTKAALKVKCSVSAGSTFVLEVRFNALPTGVTGYAGFDIYVTYSGVVSKDDSSTAKWPPCVTSFFFNTPGVSVRWGCVNATGTPIETYTGAIGTLSFNCTASGAINLVHGVGDTDTVAGEFEKTGATPNQETLNINCVVPPTPTNTSTPTPTSTNTPTPTQAPFPRQQKAGSYPYDPNNPGTLQNVFLTRQGFNGKIPPQRCEDSTDVGGFAEALSIPIVTADPKGLNPPPGYQKLGAFEFEVRFDPKLVCVNLISILSPLTLYDGTLATLPAVNGWMCIVDDKDEGLRLDGIARMGCVSKGKGAPPPLQLGANGPILGVVTVRPQPELYSQIRANQDNGITVQLLDQDCRLSDDQGHPITIFSCEDADVTIRYLEGDVEPDCIVNALDQQNIAFRWGAAKGSLVYNDRFDLEPSGTVKGDGDIDIRDLQFVFGRHASNCGTPHPPQPPRNPKA